MKKIFFFLFVLSFSLSVFAGERLVDSFTSPDDIIDSHSLGCSVKFPMEVGKTYFIRFTYRRYQVRHKVNGIIVDSDPPVISSVYLSFSPWGEIWNKAGGYFDPETWTNWTGSKDSVQFVADSSFFTSSFRYEDPTVFTIALYEVMPDECPWLSDCSMVSCRFCGEPYCITHQSHDCELDPENGGGSGSGEGGEGEGGSGEGEGGSGEGGVDDPVIPSPDISLPSGLDLSGKFNLSITPNIGTASYPTFNVPMPGGTFVNLTVGPPQNSDVLAMYRSLQAFVRNVCYLVITLFFFFKTLKLFRKNS